MEIFHMYVHVYVSRNLIFSLLSLVYAVADHSSIMHLSMLSPRVGGGGRSDPGEFDIFTRARVKFPAPGHLGNGTFPPLGTAFCPKQVVATVQYVKYVKFLTPRAEPECQNPHPGNSSPSQFPVTNNTLT